MGQTLRGNLSPAVEAVFAAGGKVKLFSNLSDGQFRHLVDTALRKIQLVSEAFQCSCLQFGRRDIGSSQAAVTFA